MVQLMTKSPNEEILVFRVGPPAFRLLSTLPIANGERKGIWWFLYCQMSHHGGRHAGLADSLRVIPRRIGHLRQTKQHGQPYGRKSAAA